MLRLKTEMLLKTGIFYYLPKLTFPMNVNYNWKQIFADSITFFVIFGFSERKNLSCENKEVGIHYFLLLLRITLPWTGNFWKTFMKGKEDFCCELIQVTREEGSWEKLKDITQLEHFLSRFL